LIVEKISAGEKGGGYQAGTALARGGFRLSDVIMGTKSSTKGEKMGEKKRRIPSDLGVPTLFRGGGKTLTER